MTRICLIAACVCLSVSPCFSKTGLIAQDDEFGNSKQTWLGGIGSMQDEHLAWHSASAELDSFDPKSWIGKLNGGGKRNFRLRVDILEGNRVAMTARRRGKERRFTGSLVDGVLDLRADDEAVPDRVILRRIQKINREKLAALAGVYELSAGHSIAITSGAETLAMTDFKTGLIRRLYPVAPDRYVAGPAIGVPSPVEFELEFQQKDDSAIALSIKRVKDNLIRKANRKSAPIAEEFSYQSFDGTAIAGTLHKPSSGSGPFPAVVWVHGSGRATRTSSGSWPLYFTNLGFAVLAVDKRGVGASEGTYNMPEGGFDNFPHMKRRSKDVAAAVKALSNRADIIGDQIGLVGASQAGWVIPMTVEKCQPSFSIILFGGATPLSVEGQYSRLADENSSGAKLRPVDELIEELREYRPVDPGIDSELSKMNYPSLWLYGARDRSNPSQICVDLINRVCKESERDFAVMLFPTGNHGMLRCRFGGSAEYYSLQRLVPDLHQSIENWLSSKKLLPKR